MVMKVTVSVTLIVVTDVVVMNLIRLAMAC
jgi:hypothetical protein